MLVIRLRRIGRTHDPHYRIVVAEHTAPVQGKFLTEVGHYHPKSKELVVQKEAFLDWLSKGAKPSNTVAKLAKRAEMEHKQIQVKEYHAQPKKKAQEAAAAKAQPKEAPVTEAPAEEPTEDVVEETSTVEETPEEQPSEEASEEPASETEETSESEESTEE